MREGQAQEGGKALSIRQPWVELILRDVKSIELRQWNTPYRGRLWLHAPLTRETVPVLGLDDVPLFVGGYVGCAELRTVLRMDAGRWSRWQTEHCDPGTYVAGTLGWVLANVVRFQEPLPAPGNQGLFEPKVDHLAMLHERFRQQAD